MYVFNIALSPGTFFLILLASLIDSFVSTNFLNWHKKKVTPGRAVFCLSVLNFALVVKPPTSGRSKCKYFIHFLRFLSFSKLCIRSASSSAGVEGRSCGEYNVNRKKFKWENCQFLLLVAHPLTSRNWLIQLMTMTMNRVHYWDNWSWKLQRFFCSQLFRCFYFLFQF